MPLYILKYLHYKWPQWLYITIKLLHRSFSITQLNLYSHVLNLVVGRQQKYFCKLRLILNPLPYGQKKNWSVKYLTGIELTVLERVNLVNLQTIWDFHFSHPLWFNLKSFCRCWHVFQAMLIKFRIGILLILKFFHHSFEHYLPFA